MQRWKEFILRVYLVCGESEYASTNEVIPIYNIDELKVVGTGDYLKIKNRIYQCGRGMSYILKDDIIVDVDEDLMTGRIGFNDYKLYSSTYYIDKFSHDIKYYKDEDYWKVLVHKKFDKNKENEKTNDKYTENEFSIINEYKLPENSIFMIVWSDENNELTSYDIIQNSKRVTNLSDIEVYNKNLQFLNNEEGEFYIFLKL